MRADRACNIEHVANVSRAVLVGRRADRDELEQPVRHAFCDVGRELQPARSAPATHDCLEPGLVDRQLAPLQPLDLGGVDVDTNHVIAGLGEASPRHQPDVAGAENRYPHALRSIAPRGEKSTRSAGHDRHEAPVRCRELGDAGGSWPRELRRRVLRATPAETSLTVGELAYYTPRQQRAISSAGERSLHTGEAAGSIPASPTTSLKKRPRRALPGCRGLLPSAAWCVLRCRACL